MEKLGTFFSSHRYRSLPSSPSMGAGRRSRSSRFLKPCLIIAAIVLTLSLVLLTSRHSQYITQQLPASLHPGKILPVITSTSDDDSTRPAASPKADPFELPATTVAQIQNASLGFERVMLINLPKRTDKLDASSLAASYTGFNFTVVEGVRNEDVAPVSLPWNFNSDGPNVHGCWRAHLNAIRTIVREGLTSALIIEDDSDWDINLKAQLPPIAAGTQRLLRNTSTPSFHLPHSPYGDDWDLLWLGHCASELRSDTARMLIHNDPTVRPPSKKWEMWSSGFNAHGPNMTNSTRVISRANNAICTNAYAVSLKGAHKILYYASIKPNPDAIDTRLNNLCDSKYKKDYPDFDCLHVYPSLFNAYKKAGRTDGDSDQENNKKVKDVKMRDHGQAWNIVYSVMLNLGNLVLGKEPEVQWPEDGWETERELDEGKGVMLEWQEEGWAKWGSGSQGVAKEMLGEELKGLEEEEEQEEEQEEEEEEEGGKPREGEKSKEIKKKPQA